MGWMVSTKPPTALPPGKTPYPLYRRLFGPQGRSGRVRKISPPPGFDPRTVQHVASRYTGWSVLAKSGRSINVPADKYAFVLSQKILINNISTLIDNVPSCVPYQSSVISLTGKHSKITLYLLHHQCLLSVMLYPLHHQCLLSVMLYPLHHQCLLSVIFYPLKHQSLLFVMLYPLKHQCLLSVMLYPLKHLCLLSVMLYPLKHQCLLSVMLYPLHHQCLLSVMLHFTHNSGVSYCQWIQYFHSIYQFVYELYQSLPSFVECLINRIMADTTKIIGGRAFLEPKSAKLTHLMIRNELTNGFIKSMDRWTNE